MSETIPMTGTGRDRKTVVRDNSAAPPAPQVWGVVCALVLLALLCVVGAGFDPLNIALTLIGAGLGMALFHASFGFTGAWRRAMSAGDMAGVNAQFLMLAIAMILFAMILPGGSFLGRAVGGAIAPVSLSMAFGAFLFGIGMHLAGACASGTLFATGGGSGRMAVVLIFFCLGGFWASQDLADWQTLPGLGSISLAEELGWTEAILLQLFVLGGFYLILRRRNAGHVKPSRPRASLSLRRLLRGPWSFTEAAAVLAILNALTLVVAGHPWSITWAFTLWAAKSAVIVGWDPMTSSFWSGGFPLYALNRSVFLDSTSVMNFGLIAGAMLAAALAGRLRFSAGFSFGSLASAILGGLALGYGSRIAYGCNIGAFFSGIASTSLHGWIWIIAAVSGNYAALKVRQSYAKRFRAPIEGR